MTGTLSRKVSGRYFGIREAQLIAGIWLLGYEVALSSVTFV